MALAVAKDLREQGFTVEVLEGRDAFAGLEKQWNAALAKGPRDEPMLRHEWMKAWIENFAPGAVLRVFVARSAGNELQAAVPLYEIKERNLDTCFVPMTTWATPCNDQSQRGGVLLGPRGLEALQAIWDKLVETPGWDRLRLRELPDGGGEWSLREIAEKAGYPCGLWVSLRSPYLPLPELPKPELVAPPLPEPAAPAAPSPEVTAAAPSPELAAASPSVEPVAPPKAKKPPKPPKQKNPAPLPDRYATVEANVDSKFRQNLRRRKRRLAEQGEVKYFVVDGKDAKKLDEALADFFVIEASGWKGKGGTAIAQKPELVGFYTQLARDAARRGALALGFLTVGGKVIAAHMTLVQAGRSFLLKLGYDEAFAEFSPGQQLVSEAIKDSCQRGLREFDFLGPWMEWKADWETRVRTHQWLTIFRPTRAGVLVHEARYTAWPVAKSLVARAKQSLADWKASRANSHAPAADSQAPADSKASPESNAAADSNAPVVTDSKPAAKSKPAHSLSSSIAATPS
jgi:hypothetical protein